ncbi:MAG: OmpH family outer membrane protein [Prevotella sp.]|jgi:outer membrane protein|nr:OmpH family outer membrane protein [Prevotella sp.]MCH3994981.1 OmpH family outer membrane protein [Prevotella sp.]
MKKLLFMLMLMMPMSIFAQKFGVVDLDAIVQSLPEYTAAQTELKNLNDQDQKDLQSMQAEVQRKYDEYQKSASTMNATAKQAKEKELQDLGDKYQQAAQQKSQDFQKAQQEKLAPVQAKVSQVIEKVGKEGGYTSIFMKGSMPYISATLVKDVTAECKAEILKMK